MKNLVKLIVLLLSTNVYSYEVDIYSQTIYLHKYNNPITQNKVSLKKRIANLEYYVGAFIDHDKKTDADEVYTDAQVSPLLGVQSPILNWKILYNRFFLETRYIHRTKSFTDDRPKEEYEVRFGLMGHRLLVLKEHLMLENYYAYFYSRMYDERFIFQGWSRQGLRVKNFDIFSEIFWDTFDQTRSQDATFDWRPGLRFHYTYKNVHVQLIHQWLHHFSNLDFAGRNEQRSTLVLATYF
ncbi:MAG TPA: hypothetical protein VKY27_01835 [Bacteriovoracaceae bacterium]|nr:hypothetical protein [Bacteriovoracaceae bacterium]